MTETAHAAANHVASVKDYFDRLPELYDKTMAHGLNCIFQWVLTGDGGGEWHAVLDSGELTVHEGRHQKANLTITATAQDWLDIVNGKFDSVAMYEAGKMRVTGEFPLYRKIRAVFIPGAHH